MRLLAISTSTPRGSAAVLDGDVVIGASGYTDLEGHAAERIFLAVEEALRQAGAKPSSLEAFACDVGPGSFTGVRVGVSAAKGLALGRGRPLAGVGSLEGMAAAAFRSGAAKPGEIVVAALDAKKRELFVAAYGAGGELVFSPRHLPVDEAAALVLGELGASGRQIRVVGQAAEGDAAFQPLLLRAPALDLPDAAELGRIAARRLAAGGDFDPELVEPVYVRPPDAKPMASGAAG